MLILVCLVSQQIYTYIIIDIGKIWPEYSGELVQQHGSWWSISDARAQGISNYVIDFRWDRRIFIFQWLVRSVSATHVIWIILRDRWYRPDAEIIGLVRKLFYDRLLGFHQLNCRNVNHSHDVFSSCCKLTRCIQHFRVNFIRQHAEYSIYVLHILHQLITGHLFVTIPTSDHVFGGQQLHSFIMNSLGD